MATQAQIDANRRNAQKSTGPRTESGKAAVRGNAIRHGLCSSWATAQVENREEANQLLEQLREDNQPAGANEEILVFKMAEAFWNLKRASTLFAGELNNLENGIVPTVFALIQRYYNSADRAFNQNLKLLRQLQKERKQQEQTGFEEIGSVPQSPAEASEQTSVERFENPPIRPEIVEIVAEGSPAGPSEAQPEAA